MEFEIKKGVPLPKHRGKPRKYDIPLETMEVNDMIEVPMSKTQVVKEHKTIRNFVLRFKHKNPNKYFSVRQMDKAIGIWRTK